MIEFNIGTAFTLFIYIATAPPPKKKIKSTSKS